MMTITNSNMQSKELNESTLRCNKNDHYKIHFGFFLSLFLNAKNWTKAQKH
jgi:hypothetical protein